MGLFSELFRKKQKVNSSYGSFVRESNNHASNQTPLWLSIPSAENREKDKTKTTDYSNVHIFFKNGEIQDVVPDVNNYYLATHYNINGTVYDVTNISSVNEIPLPSSKAVVSMSLGTPVYRLEYLLRIRAGFAREEGNNELAYALMDKGTKMLKYSNLSWQRHDYLREYYWLLDDNRIEDAQSFFNEIEEDLTAPYSEKEYIKEVQHYNYALLKRNFPTEIPKSFSAYMRNYNAKNDKFKLCQNLAQQIGINL